MRVQVNGELRDRSSLMRTSRAGRFGWSGERWAAYAGMVFHSLEASMLHQETKLRRGVLDSAEEH